MKFISYVRVSTQRQGDSGLGLEAQRSAVGALIGRQQGDLLTEFVEIESGRKGGTCRPVLSQALAACKKQKAALVVGKLDRLSRDVRFFLATLDDSKVDIRFADLPDVCPKTDEGRMLLINMANFAEFEGRRIGTRTKAALQAAKKNGTKLGTAGPANLRPNIEARQHAAQAFAKKMAPTIAAFQKQGLSQRAIVAELNATGCKTPGSGETWSLVQLQRLLKRLPQAA